MICCTNGGPTSQDIPKVSHQPTAMKTMMIVSMTKMDQSTTQTQKKNCYTSGQDAWEPQRTGTPRSLGSDGATGQSSPGAPKNTQSQRNSLIWVTIWSQCFTKLPQAHPPRPCIPERSVGRWAVAAGRPGSRSIRWTPTWCPAAPENSIRSTAKRANPKKKKKKKRQSLILIWFLLGIWR